MGNQHPTTTTAGANNAGGSSAHSSPSSSTLAEVVRKSARSSRLRLAQLRDKQRRRRSTGVDVVDGIKGEQCGIPSSCSSSSHHHQHANFRSFTFGQQHSSSSTGGTTALFYTEESLDIADVDSTPPVAPPCISCLRMRNANDAIDIKQNCLCKKLDATGTSAVAVSPPRIEINGVLKKCSTVTIVSTCYQQQQQETTQQEPVDKEKCAKNAVVTAANGNDGMAPPLKMDGIGTTATTASTKIDDIAASSMAKQQQERRRGSATNSCGSLPSYTKHRAQKVDSRKICVRKLQQRARTPHNDDVDEADDGENDAMTNNSKNAGGTTENDNNNASNYPGSQQQQQTPADDDDALQHHHHGRPMMGALRATPIAKQQQLGMFARSLDAQMHQHRYNTDICMEMKPLAIRTARSMSPLFPLHPPQQNGIGALHYQRGSFSGGLALLNGGGGILGREQVEALQQSWLRAKQRIQQFAGSTRCFGFFAFDRIFERAPELKPLFGISPGMSLQDLDLDNEGGGGTEQQQQQMEQHPFLRHSRIFNSIIELAVRNAAELKTEIFPALFTYGQRHYKPRIADQFNERTVRLFCSQVVGTMCDLLDDELSSLALEAWVEMVTFLGRAILSGFEHERQSNHHHQNSNSSNGGNGNKRFSLHKI